MSGTSAPTGEQRVDWRIAAPPAGRWFDSPIVRAMLALASGVVFYALRNWFINPDGEAFPMKFMVDVPLRGFHATHDEMWELYIHSKFWAFTNTTLGWSVAQSYQVLSCAAGAVFVFLLLTYVRRFASRHQLPAFLACVAGGYMQLFFGDVENYTLMTALVMAYFLAAAWSLRDGGSVAVPSILLALAITFHLEAGFLLPSLAYLYLSAWARGQRGQVGLAIAGSLFVVGGTFVFFHVAGLPIGDLWTNSHALGHGGHFRQMLATPSVSYYVQIARLSLLLVPAWIVVPFLLLSRRISWDPINVHLALASIVMTVFVLCWKPQLGIDNDWNLYAMAAVPISLLAWRNVFNAIGDRRIPWPVIALIALFSAHSYSWVIANHFL